MEKNIRLLPSVLLCVFSAKALVLGASLADAVVLLGIGALAAFYEHKNVHGKIAAFENKLKEYESSLNQKSKDFDAIKSHVSSIKIAQQFKTPQNRV